MLTATGYISGANWSSGNLLYTNPSGVRSVIKDIIPIPWDTSTDFNIELIEVYPTGLVPNINYTSTRTLIATRSSHKIENANIKCSSSCGSQVRVKSSGQMNIAVNYINIDQPVSSWPGYNSWKAINH